MSRKKKGLHKVYAPSTKTRTSATADAKVGTPQGPSASISGLPVVASGAQVAASAAGSHSDAKVERAEPDTEAPKAVQAPATSSDPEVSAAPQTDRTPTPTPPVLRKDQARAIWAKIKDADKDGSAGTIATEKLTGK